MADDLLQGLKDALRDNKEQDPDVDPQAAVEKFLKALENMPGLSEEDKKNLISGALGGDSSKLPTEAGITSNPWTEFLILFSLISFVVLALGFLGYRLYNNALEREKRREIKRLQKEQRKKK